MKKQFLIVCIAIAMASCASMKELKELPSIDPSQSLFKIDFSPYTKNGFLITPEKYIGAYESIGLVDYQLMPGAVYVVVGKQKNPYYTGTDSQPMYIDKKMWKIDEINFKMAMDSLYNICTKMGADALVNFSLGYPSDDYGMISNPVTIKGYSISGYAIKRK